MIALLQLGYKQVLKSCERIIIWYYYTLLSNRFTISPRRLNNPCKDSSNNYSGVGSGSGSKRAAGKVSVFGVHPGVVRTEVTRNMSWLMQLGNHLAAPIMSTMQKTPAQGAYCSVYCATDPDLVAPAPRCSGEGEGEGEGEGRGQGSGTTSSEQLDLGGELFFHCKPIPLSAAARNVEAARRLWTLSAELTGFADE